MKIKMSKKLLCLKKKKFISKINSKGIQKIKISLIIIIMIYGLLTFIHHHISDINSMIDGMEWVTNDDESNYKLLI